MVPEWEPGRIQQKKKNPFRQSGGIRTGSAWIFFRKFGPANLGINTVLTIRTGSAWIFFRKFGPANLGINTVLTIRTESGRDSDGFGLDIFP
jgi:hypothetical protein